MKKLFVMLALIAGLAGCGSSSSGPVVDNGSSSTNTYPFTMDMGSDFGPVAVSCHYGVLVAETKAGQLSMQVAQC